MVAEAPRPQIIPMLPQAEATELTKIHPMWVWEEEFIQAQGGERCPIFGDVLPAKSVTVLVPASMLNEAVYSLEYVHGTHSVSKKQWHGAGMIALRSDYKCW